MIIPFRINLKHEQKFESVLMPMTKKLKIN